MAEISELDLHTSIKTILAATLQNIEIKKTGTSGQGDGFIGDITFFTVTGTAASKPQSLDIVVKCSKSSQALRDKVPVKQSFHNEINFYDTVVPAFHRFQLSKAVKEPFAASLPKFHGKLLLPNAEVFVLENLKADGYDLWDKTEPLTTEHLLMVLKEFAKYHAVSLAMQDQAPAEFDALAANVRDVILDHLETTNMLQMFEEHVEFAYNELRATVDAKTLQKWISLKEQVKHVTITMRKEKWGVKVFTHGDCWNNNFMFKHDENDKTLPKKVAIIDWPHVAAVNPVYDISYFLFCSISKTDLMYFSYLLDFYYKSLASSVAEMGSDAAVLYPKNAFLADWQKYARFGLILSSVIVKLAYVNKENQLDLAKSADEGKELSESFAFELKDKSAYVERMGNIVRFAVEKELIE